MIISFCFFIVIILFKRPLWMSALAASAVFVLLNLTVLDFQSFIKVINSAIITAELGLIIVGAFVFYKINEQQNRFSFLTNIDSMSKLQVLIMLTYFFGTFIEGTSGFGTPAMLVAPMLIALGYQIKTATIIPLVANTTSVIFGAAGTPVRVGLSFFQEKMSLLLPKILFINILPALLLPWILAYLYKKIELGEVKFTKKERLMLLIASLSYVIPFSTALIFGYEFPSIAAGGLGLILFLSTLNYLLKTNIKVLNIFFNLWPYWLFTAVLFIYKLIASNYKVYFYIRDHALKPIPYMQVGFVFLVVSILVLLIHRSDHRKHQLMDAIEYAFKRLKKPLLSILLLVAYTQIISEELLLLSSQFIQNLSEVEKIFSTAFAGLLGSFLTGSATMSNLLMSPMLESDYTSQLPLSLWLIALLHTGSAVGNSISLQNILMVKSVTAGEISEITVLKYSLLFSILYLLLSSMMAFIVC